MRLVALRRCGGRVNRLDVPNIQPNNFPLIYCSSPNKKTLAQRHLYNVLFVLWRSLLLRLTLSGHISYAVRSLLKGDGENCTCEQVTVVYYAYEAIAKLSISFVLVIHIHSLAIERFNKWIRREMTYRGLYVYNPNDQVL